MSRPPRPPPPPQESVAKEGALKTVKDSLAQIEQAKLRDIEEEHRLKGAVKRLEAFENTLVEIQRNAPGGGIEAQIAQTKNLRANALLSLAVNANALIQALLRQKPSTAKGVYLRSITMSSTMGPGVRIDPLHFASSKTEEG